MGIIKTKLFTTIVRKIMMTKISFRSFMLTGITVAVSIFFAASCSPPQKANETNVNQAKPTIVEKTTSDKSEENVKMYTQLWQDIINNGKVELLDTKFVPNCVLRLASSEIKGQADVKAYYMTLLTAFSNPNFKIDEAFGKDDKVVKRWTFTGTHTGELNGIKPTNKKITFSGITIARIADGMVVEETDFADDLGLMTQLGAIPVKGK
jgi:predicted ester cyclase